MRHGERDREIQMREKDLEVRIQEEREKGK